MVKLGKFITLEGIEGAGKSTVLQLVRGHLAAAGKALITTREPGGTVLGEAIRSLLLEHKYGAISPMSELLLMFAARAEHLAQIIRPALQQGKWILCDRFTDATYAYQGEGRGVPLEQIAQLEQWVQGELRPDLTLLLDVEVDLGLERARRRSDPNRFETEQEAFFERVRMSYLDMAKRDPGRYRIVDTRVSLPAVQKNIHSILDQYMCDPFL